jgi:hypothetical protein
MDRMTRWIAVIIASCFLVACGGTSTVTASADTDTRFSNFLVIGISGNYDNRAHLERRIVSQLRSEGASASAYYSVVRGDAPITRDEVLAVIEENGFDSVLAIRRIDSDVAMKVTKSREETDATPMGERFVNLFRRDYTTYTTPGSVNLLAQAVLTIELYDVSSEAIVFSFDHETRQDEDIGLLIDQTAAAVVRRLDREKLIGSQ